MLYPTIFLVIMFFGYNYLAFELVDTLLKSPKLKRPFRVFLGLVNILIACTLTLTSESTTFFAYLVFAIVFLIELILFYKDKLICSFFVMLACLIHVMIVQSLVVSIYALVTSSTIYNVANDLNTLIATTGIAFFVLNCMIHLVIKKIPAVNIRIVIQQSTQLVFMTGWVSVFALCLLINSRVYAIPNDHPILIINQIASPIAILIGMYIMLFFAIKTNQLLGYKEKTEELQQTVDKQRQYRTAIDKDVFRIIEVNFSKGILLSGFEDYEKQLGDLVHQYSNMLAFMIKATVHSDDREEFIRYLSPLTVVKEFEDNKTQIEFDYRRLMPNGSYVWMHVLIALRLDDEGNDVMGFVQIKDIDSEKKQQLDLQYKAERDLLTGLYNKVTTENLIVKQLVQHRQGTGVLFLIDIDNFKTINDRLGHLYGDAVLSELSERLQKIFREGDVVGRIGGDEFLVYAYDLPSGLEAIIKAKKICAAFLQMYSNDKNEGYSVSSSVGIAIYPKDGRDFETLYKCADIALYNAKAHGKNTCSLYDESITMSYLPTRTEIDTNGVVQKNFKENRIEYAFRLLYGNEDTETAVDSVLELIAKNFGFSRANIFEFNEISTHFSTVFEWCKLGIKSVRADYMNVPISEFEFIISALEKSGGMFLAVPSDFPEYAQESYKNSEIKAVVHFSILEQGRLMGVIAFQYCEDDIFYLSDFEFEELRTIFQVLSVFIGRRLSKEREQRHFASIQAMMNNMNCISYLIDRETYEVYYENDNTLSITGATSVGKKCYETYRGYNAPCEDCPMAHLSDTNPKCTVELYTQKFDIYTKTSAAYIDWSNNRPAMLISSVDVTEYKSKSDK